MDNAVLQKHNIDFHSTIFLIWCSAICQPAVKENFQLGTVWMRSKNFSTSARGKWWISTRGYCSCGAKLLTPNGRAHKHIGWTTGCKKPILKQLIPLHPIKFVQHELTKWTVLQNLCWIDIWKVVNRSLRWLNWGKQYKPRPQQSKVVPSFVHDRWETFM